MNAPHADRTIPVPHKGVQLQKKKYRLSDIAKTCYEAVRDDHKYMRAFAKAFSPDLAGLKDLFDFCDRHFQYLEDPAYETGAVQAIQSPQWLWHKTKIGDCKSYTNFIACTVLNMGLPVVLRLVDYGNPTEKHIYPLAILGKKMVPLDVVFRKQQGGRFAQEKPYRRKIKDVVMQPISAHVKSPGLYKVGATQTGPSPQQLWDAVQQMEQKVADGIPDDIVTRGGDVTTMTNGQLDRLMAVDRFRVFAKTEQDGRLAAAYTQAANAISAGSVAGIGSTAEPEFGKRLNSFIVKTARDNRPAFQNFSISIPSPSSNEEVTVDGIGKVRLKKFIKKVAKKVTGVFKKIVNWIFKGAGKKMGPYFLFLAAGGAVGAALRKNPIIAARVKAQKKAFAWIAKKGKFSESKLMGLATTGIREEFGGSPDQVVKQFAGGKIGVIPVALAAAPKIIGAMGMVIQVIKKISGLFKKKEAMPAVGQEYASDPALLEGYGTESSSPGQLPKKKGRLTPMKPAPNTNHDSASSSGSGSSGGMAIAAAVAALLLMG